MNRAFSLNSAKPYMFGATGSASGANWRFGPIATCMTSDFRGAISFTRPKSRFGGLKQQPGWRRLLRGMPAIVFSELEHDPEKWEPVFRKDHAQTKREL